jgi:lipopolysaccharide biosynthesis glycosyltransferase
MKRLLLQVNIEPNHTQVGRKYHYIKDLYELSHRQAKKYAQKHNADYLQINDYDFLPNKHAVYQKLKFLELDNYDQILYIDSDAVILDDIPNIFDLDVPFAAVPDYDWSSTAKTTIQIKQKLCNIYNASNDYLPFCSGVILANKNFIQSCRPIYKKYIDEYETQHDQGILNRCVVELGEKYHTLSSDWGAWYKRGKYIIHLGAHHKKNFDLTSFCKKYKISI